jgi:hypothetical protein
VFKRIIVLTMVLMLLITGVAGAATRDRDKDGIKNSIDNCPSVANAGQADRDKAYDDDFNSNGTTKGNLCDPDDDTPVTPPPPPADKPNVCAHWHVAAQRGISGIDTPAELQPQFEAAQQAGVECFALNVNGWDSSYQFNTNLVWDAATQWNSAHPGYKIYLYPSIDFASISSEPTFEAISRHKYNDPARLRVDGGVHGSNLPVTQTWQGQANFSVSGWDRILDEEAAAGFPVFFMPYFSASQFGGVPQMVDAYNGTNNADPSDDVADGFYNFGGIASGDNAESGYQKNRDFTAAMTTGMDAQIGCSPHFNRHSDTGQFGNRIIGDYEGFHAFNKCMQGFAFEQKPRFMEFTTWNDYLEGSYLGVNYTQAQLPSAWDGNYLDHGAFREISRLYVDAYESGAAQVDNSKDFIALAHRPHLENATGINGSTDSIGLPKQTDYSVVEDRLYVFANLKSSGMLLVTSGNQSYTFFQPAGVSEVSIPLLPGGIQSVELWRGETKSLTATSNIQVQSGPVSLFNYNVNTAFAQE